MSEEKKKPSQPDKNLAAEERPVPSQAEGDRETIEEDLEEKNESDKGGKS
jgi:hypothetical protein